MPLVKTTTPKIVYRFESGDNAQLNAEVRHEDKWLVMMQAITINIVMQHIDFVLHMFLCFAKCEKKQRTKQKTQFNKKNDKTN